MNLCPECNTTLPDRSRYCTNCGAKQVMVKNAPIEKIIFDIHEPIETQFTEQFFLALKKRVLTEHEADQFQAFSERIYESGFRDTLTRRAIELQESINKKLAINQADYKSINQKAELIFEDILDYFIIHFCPDLTITQIPQAVLKHQYGNNKKSPLKHLIFDYLDFDNEKERIYVDLLTMPVEKLKNAGNAYLFPARDEKIWFICDTTVFGNAKEGFAMTDTTLYWRAPLQKPQAINYKALQEIKKEKDWIKINGVFFNINPSLNLKMLKLLKKIKFWKY